MIEVSNYDTLDLHACDILNDFEIFCKIPEQSLNRHETVGWSEWVKVLNFRKRDRDENYLEYSFIGSRFLLKYGVMLFDDYVFMRTYEIEMDKTNYPQKTLTHIRDLDIFIGLAGETVFRDRNVFPNDTHKIRQFCPQYIEEVAKYIRRCQYIQSTLF
jgi:hypothetical protein